MQVCELWHSAWFCHPAPSPHGSVRVEGRSSPPSTDTSSNGLKLAHPLLACPSVRGEDECTDKSAAFPKPVHLPGSLGPPAPTQKSGWPHTSSPSFRDRKMTFTPLDMTCLQCDLRGGPHRPTPSYPLSSPVLPSVLPHSPPHCSRREQIHRRLGRLASEFTQVTCPTAWGSRQKP